MAVEGKKTTTKNWKLKIKKQKALFCVSFFLGDFCRARLQAKASQHSMSDSRLRQKVTLGSRKYTVLEKQQGSFTLGPWLICRAYDLWAVADGSFVPPTQTVLPSSWPVPGQSQLNHNCLSNMEQDWHDDWQRRFIAPNLKSHISHISLLWLIIPVQIKKQAN